MAWAVRQAPSHCWEKLKPLGDVSEDNHHQTSRPGSNQPPTGHVRRPAHFGFRKSGSLAILTAIRVGRVIK
jgi:hypothetical protein